MVSRLMINLRDPILHRQTDSDEIDTMSYAGHVSTVLLELNTLTAVGASPEKSNI